MWILEQQSIGKYLSTIPSQCVLCYVFCTIITFDMCRWDLCFLPDCYVCWFVTQSTGADSTSLIKAGFHRRKPLFYGLGKESESPVGVQNVSESSLSHTFCFASSLLSSPWTSKLVLQVCHCKSRQQLKPDPPTSTPSIFLFKTRLIHQSFLSSFVLISSTDEVL